MEAPVSDNGVHTHARDVRRGDVDQTTWNKGAIVASILAAIEERARGTYVE